MMKRTSTKGTGRPKKYNMKKPKNGHIYGEVGQHYFLRGKHQGLIFFIRNNKQCVRTQGNMTTDRWWKDEKFANSRGASREFGAACAYSGAIRKGLGQMAKDVGGTKLLHNKVVKRVLHSFKGLPGRRGERVLSGGHVAARLQRLAWNKDGRTNLLPFGFSKAVVEPMIWKPKVEFEFLEGFSVPGWATQVRVVFSVVAVGDMVKRKNGKQYAVARGHKEWHGVSRSVESEWMDVAEMESRSIRLRQDIATEPLVPALNLAAVDGSEPFVQVLNLAAVDGSEPFVQVLDLAAVDGSEPLVPALNLAAVDGSEPLVQVLDLAAVGEFEVEVQGLAEGKEGTQGRLLRSGSLRQAQDGAAALAEMESRSIGLRQDIATEPLVPALNLAAYSVRPDLVFPEAVELGMGLVVVTAVEVRALQPNGAVFDQQFVGMECVWAGNVASSIAENRLRDEREAKARVVADWLRQQEPVLLHCEESDPPEVHERVARDRLRQAEAIEMMRKALE